MAISLRECMYLQAKKGGNHITDTHARTHTHTGVNSQSGAVCREETDPPSAPNSVDKRNEEMDSRIQRLVEAAKALHNPPLCLRHYVHSLEPQNHPAASMMRRMKLTHSSHFVFAIQTHKQAYPRESAHSCAHTHTHTYTRTKSNTRIPTYTYTHICTFSRT